MSKTIAATCGILTIAGAVAATVLYAENSYQKKSESKTQLKQTRQELYDKIDNAKTVAGMKYLEMDLKITRVEIGLILDIPEIERSERMQRTIQMLYKKEESITKLLGY